MPDRVLPAHPDLEQYKKQAKELVKDRATAAPEAMERIGQYHPRFRGLPRPDIQQASFKLSDAQLTIAREHDFESWTAFAAHIQASRPDSHSFAARIPVGGIELEAEISGVEKARGVVLFTQASGSSRYHPSFRAVARELNRGSLCTVLVDLLTEEEELTNFEELRHDIKLLGGRIAGITDWIGQHPRLRDLGLGYFASGNGSAAAVVAAGERASVVRALVSGGGRADLAGPWLWRVQAPTLFVVGSEDTVGLGFTHSIAAPFPQNGDRKFAVIDGAHHLFEEPDALQKTALLARDWFRQYLAR